MGWSIAACLHGGYYDSEEETPESYGHIEYTFDNVDKCKLIWKPDNYKAKLYDWVMPHTKYDFLYLGFFLDDDDHTVDVTVFAFHENGKVSQKTFSFGGSHVSFGNIRYDQNTSNKIIAFRIYFGHNVHDVFCGALECFGHGYFSHQSHSVLDLKTPELMKALKHPGPLWNHRCDNEMLTEKRYHQ